MGDKWAERLLGDITDNFDGMRVPVKEADRRAGPYPYYGASGIVDHVDNYLFDGEYLLIAEDGENLRTQTTPIAFMARGKFWVNNHAHIVRGNGYADTRFLMYALSASDISGYLTGSTMPKLTQGNMNRIPLLTPLLSEQRVIAHILGTLDDKIELNRKMNETLEAMARAIFKEWFVDATANGLPKGWCESTIGELCEFAYGRALKEEVRRPGSIPVYGSNGQVGWHDEAFVKGPGIVIGRKGNPGIVTWSPTDFFPIDTTFYVVPKGECRSLYFLFYALRTHDFATLGADSAVPGLNRNMAYMSKQVIPPQNLLDTFDKQIRPIFDRIHQNTEQSRTLAAIRDALLPKLMSGAIKIS